MASKKTVEQPLAQAQTKAPAPSPSPQYDLDELRQLARELFGVSGETVAGALHGYDKSSLTVDEAKRRVAQYMKRKVL